MIYLLSVSGEDRKGLVEALASKIESLGGNWLQSRLCRLEGEFAGIVTVEFEEPLAELPSQVESLRCLWKEMQKSSNSGQYMVAATVNIMAADRPGIIKQISHVLASMGANVEEVESRVRSAPFSGERMFEALYRISVDTDADRDSLQSGLEALAEELMCDIDYKES